MRDGYLLAVVVTTMWILYNVAMLAILPVALPFLLVALAVRKRYRVGLAERLGFLPRSVVDAVRGRRTIWIHAVSVGEVQAVAPLVRALRKIHPEKAIVLSTVTVTGRKTGERLLPEVDARLYFPFDLYWIVGRVVRSLRPELFIFVEVEIWPNLLFFLKREGIRSVLVNGRISPSSFRRYRLVRPFIRSVLGSVTAFSMQGERDLRYALELGAPAERMIRTGNMKIDQAATVASQGNGGEARRALGLDEKVSLWIAASTHSGEEEVVLEAYGRLLGRHPDLVLLLAPRHPERLGEVEGKAMARGFSVIRKTAIGSRPPTGLGRVVLLDTMGELASTFCAATVTFVGGSLVPIGGHNILEPGAFGVPVIHGPHMENFREIVDLFVRREAVLVVSDADGLCRAVDELLRRPDRREAMGRRASALISENRGAVQKNLELIESLV